MNVNSALRALREYLGQVEDLHASTSLLEWDQQTYMPPKGAEARGLQLATLSGLSHRIFTARKLGALLARLHDVREQLDPDDAKLIDETLYDYERAKRLPESFVKEFAEEQSKAFHAWIKARQQSDFGLFLPHLEKLVGLSRWRADLLGFEGLRYNALLEDYERGARAEDLRGVLATLAARQSEIVKCIAQTPVRADLGWLNQQWDEAAQWAVSIQILHDMGYDLEAGRQDRSAHPFTTSFHLNDVRITTRTHSDQLFSGLLSSLHEGGHALYEQGFLAKDARTTLAHGPSLGIHESQSRLWENIVGRSLPFWRHYLPLLRERFPGQLETVAAEEVYEAVNQVKPSLIRVEADECTYNLHVIIRFEIEVELLEGNLVAGDVPSVWNEKMKSYLGVDVPDDARGCLQDVHWSHGAFGYFPTYTLGNLYASQIFEAVLKDLPDLWQQVENGSFLPLRDWLREHVHRHGRRKTAADLVREISGTPPGAGPYLRYLEAKYSSLYGFPAPIKRKAPASPR